MGQSGSRRAFERLLDSASRCLDLFLLHLQVMLLRRADVRVPGELLHDVQWRRPGDVCAEALPQVVELASRHAGSPADRLKVARDVLPLHAVSRCGTLFVDDNIRLIGLTRSAFVQVVSCDCVMIG